jgi:poly(3-hydroxybutyrate) depolymerase
MNRDDKSATDTPLGSNRGGWRKFLRTLERGRAGGERKGSTRLREVFGFGSNPGNLRMFVYRPPTLADNPALVVVLHGCTQTAAEYDIRDG